MNVRKKMLASVLTIVFALTMMVGTAAAKEEYAFNFKNSADFDIGFVIPFAEELEDYGFVTKEELNQITSIDVVFVGESTIDFALVVMGDETMILAVYEEQVVNGKLVARVPVDFSEVNEVAMLGFAIEKKPRPTFYFIIHFQKCRGSYRSGLWRT